MARPRAFDEQEALSRAMELFWTRGYAATSVDDICRATGLSRSSLYQTFGSKRDLLDATLGLYDARAAVRLAEALGAVRPVREAVRRWLLGFVDDALSGAGRRGCFVGNCTGELASRDAAAERRLARSLERIETTLGDALSAAQARGELAAETDTVALARFLMAQVQGLRLVAKARPERAVLEDIVRTAVMAVR